MESYFWANDRCTSRSKSVILSLSTHDNLVFDLGRAAAQAIARLFSLGLASVLHLARMSVRGLSRTEFLGMTEKPLAHARGSESA